MNEQLQAVLVDLINKSIKIAQQGGEFLKGQIPDIVDQLLNWYCIYTFILFIIGIILMIGLIYGNYKFIKWCKKEDDNDYYPFLLLNLVFILIPIGFIADNLDWLKILIAPKLWLIEYAAKLIK